MEAPIHARMNVAFMDVASVKESFHKLPSKLLWNYLIGFSC